MKHLQLLTILFLSIVAQSCSDDNDDSASTQEEGFQATIDGDTFSDYSFSLGVYDITKGTNGNTLSIDVADSNGQMITLFLNGTGGHNSGTVKEMGNVDANNFMNYVLIRQQQPQLSYYSATGNVTITSNRAHPTESGHRLISGTFNITASTLDDENSASMTGSFTELDYEN